MVVCFIFMLSNEGCIIRLLLLIHPSDIFLLSAQAGNNGLVANCCLPQLDQDF